MAGFNIKTILKRKEVLKVIKDIEKLSDTFLTIKDKESALVYGSEANDSFNQYRPVEIDGEVFCWVLCNKKADIVLPIIQHMIFCEFEKKSLSKDTLENYKELNLLYNFSEKILSSLGLNEVCSITLEEARKIIKCTSGKVILKNDETGELEVIAIYESDKQFYSLTSLGIGIEKSIIEKGAGEIINDAISDPRFDGDSGNIKVIICVPLKVKNKVIGAISLGYNSHIIYKSRELKLLNALSAQAAAALESAKMFEELKEAHSETLNILLETVEMIDQGKQRGHYKRTMRYSLMIGEELKLSKKELFILKFSAILHDIGKIGIKANQTEMHPDLGVQLLKHIKKLGPALPAINFHHENFDGTGYPAGIKGEKIPLGARIIAIASEFDHLLTEAAGDFETAAAKLKKLEGTKLDPKIAAKFLNLYGKQIKYIHAEENQ